MSPKEAIRSFRDCVQLLHDAGWKITGMVNLIQPEDRWASVVDINATMGTLGEKKINTVLIELKLVKPSTPSAIESIPVTKHFTPEIETNEIIEIHGTVASVPINRHFTPTASGNVCRDCGSSNLKRSGTCETCQECGSTTGCG